MHCLAGLTSTLRFIFHKTVIAQFPGLCDLDSEFFFAGFLKKGDRFFVASFRCAHGILRCQSLFELPV